MKTGKRRTRKRTKGEGQFFKPGKNAGSKPSGLRATSHSSGIIHEFTNIDGWERIISSLEAKAEHEKRDIIGALPFYNWLHEIKIDDKHLSVSFLEHGYRCSNPKFGPITIMGSLGDGGRFNVGSAQMNPQFPYLTKFGCVYLASSPECAFAEAARPLGVHKMFKVTPKRKLILWDLYSVIADLNYVNLFETIRGSYGDRLWAYQKIPVHSQILAMKLKVIGGDGIIFESTKSNGHKNIALFFDTDESAKEALEFKEIEFPK